MTRAQRIMLVVGLALLPVLIIGGLCWRWGLLSTVPVWTSDDRRVCQGVTIQGIDVGGKSRDEVFRLLDEEEKQKIANYRIILHLPDESSVTEIPFSEMGLGIDKPKTWQAAFEQGRTGSLVEQLKARWQIWRQGVELPIYLSLDVKKAEKLLQRVGEPWYVAPEDARFRITEADQVKIVPGKEGQQIAVEDTLIQLREKLFPKGVLPEETQEFQLELRLVKIKPERTEEDLQALGVEGLVSQFTTYFDSGKIGRTNNIRLASSKLDHVLLLPGEVFSFNEVVGPRTKEEGYDEADIIQNYKYVPGIGGGVCQVSSTLYNAILLANLEIVERAPHSMIISYVEPGLDATVVYGSIDFRFKNNLESAIILKTEMGQESLTCKVFGKPIRQRVELKTFLERQIEFSTIYKEDPAVPPGKFIVERKGVPGKVYRVERHMYDTAGSLLKKEQLSRDIYPAVDQIIKRAPEESSRTEAEYGQDDLFVE
ncbi:MAG TPA: hypothetical protein GX395_01010 [Clostridia bacterium]|nr:hypothetical protein [Clostridia bacterium]